MISTKNSNQADIFLFLARSVTRLFWYYFGYYFQYHK
jgi:hypothetical protein